MKIGIYDPYLDALEGGEKYMLTAASCLSQCHVVSILWGDSSVLHHGSKKYDIDLGKVSVEKNIFTNEYSSIDRMRLSKKYDALFYLSDGSIPFVSCDLYLHFQFPVPWVKQSVTTKIKMVRVKKIICNSDFTKSYIDKIFSVKSTVLYPPVLNEAEEKFVYDKKEQLILTVGRYNKMANGEQFKKHNRTIEIFKRMIDDGLKDWKFILVISYQEKDKDAYDLEELVKGYPIEIKRNISRHELLAIYQKASIYWHASGMGEDLKRHPELTEHFGISTVEAMHFGCVPIVINAGGQKEIVTDGKTGLLWNTEKELVEDTLEIIEQQEKRILFSEAAREAAKEFTTEKFCRELSAIFS